MSYSLPARRGEENRLFIPVTGATGSWTGGAFKVSAGSDGPYNTVGTTYFTTNQATVVLTADDLNNGSFPGTYQLYHDSTLVNYGTITVIERTPDVANVTESELTSALALETDVSVFNTHTAATAAHGATGAVVGTTNTQTLTNKTLTSPVVNSPTGITKSDVGLSNVDNTSDATKNAASATLTNKTLTSPVVNSPTGIVKADVGLGNVDNTSDASKPVSTATQTALDAKANDADVVHDTGTETIAGVKTFSSSPIVPTPTTSTQAANKSYVDSITGGFGGYQGTYLTGADPTGVSDSTTAFQNAINANVTTIIPTGTYKVGQVSYTGASRHIRAEGPVTIIQTSALSCFTFSGAWDSLGSISSYATTRTNLVDAGEANPSSSDTWVTVLTMGASATVAKGDVVKIVSDDLPATNRPMAGPNYVRQGEYSTIGITSTGTTVTLGNVLQEVYTTAPRLARLQDVTFTIEGDITFDTDPAIRDTTIFGSVIMLRSAKFCRVGKGVKFYNSIGRAIGNTTYRGTFEGIVFHNLANLPSKSQYGYGVHDGGFQTIMTNCHGENLRHMYSEGAGGYVPTGSTNYDYFGGGWFGRITNCTAIGCQGQAFDTHGSAYGTVFDNCHAYGAFIGANSAGTGFYARGRRVSFVNCTTDSCFAGFGMVAAEGRIDNCHSRRSYSYGLYIGGDTDDATDITTIKPITVSNSTFEVIANYAPITVGTSGFTNTVRMRNVTGKLITHESGARGFEFNHNTTAELDNCTADFEDSTVSGALVLGINVKKDTVVLRTRNFRFRGGSAPYTSCTVVYTDGASNGLGADVEMINMEYRHASVSPTLFHANMTNKRYSSLTKYGTNWYETVLSSTFNVTAAASVALTFNDRADSVITVKFTGSAGAVTTGNMPTTIVRQGQIVNFVNTNNDVVTIPATGVTPNTTTAIAVNGTASFVFSGSGWVKLTPTA